MIQMLMIQMLMLMMIQMIQMLNFDFLEKKLGIVSPTYFVYYFSRKHFICYILLTDQV